MVRTVSLNVRGNDTPTPFISDTAGRTGRTGSTDGIREDGLIIKETLGPVHKGVDIFGSGKLRGAFVPHAVFPEVFVSSSSSIKEEGCNIEHHSDDREPCPLSHRGPADIIGH